LRGECPCQSHRSWRSGFPGLRQRAEGAPPKFNLTSSPCVVGVTTCLADLIGQSRPLHVTVIDAPAGVRHTPSEIANASLCDPKRARVDDAPRCGRRRSETPRLGRARPTRPAVLRAPRAGRRQAGAAQHIPSKRLRTGCTGARFLPYSSWPISCKVRAFAVQGHELVRFAEAGCWRRRSCAQGLGEENS